MKNKYFSLTSTISFIFILSATVAFAQSEDRTHSLEENSKALQFQITDNFNLTSFSGSAISYKRHSSDTRAFRVGLSFGNLYRTVTNTQEDNDWDLDTTQLSTSVDLSLMRYNDPDSDIKFFYGFGPRIDADYRNQNQENSESQTEYTRKIVGLSAFGFTGVEWFFHRSISLHAEYGASLRVGYVSEDMEGEVNPNKSES